MIKDVILKNNIKIIYKHSESSLTSICISLDAGAGTENKKMGTAHAVEHMVYKGTKNRSEEKINQKLSSLFAFQNAMTNYPYVIFYGTLHQDDFEEGIELFSDILINPRFEKKGFLEEMEIIKQELEEWDEDIEQYCEDKLFLNAFPYKRIGTPIIGTKRSLEEMTVEDIKEFYNERYLPEKASIAVVSSLDFEQVKEIVKKYFGVWESKGERVKTVKNDGDKAPDKEKIMFEKKAGSKNARAEAVFSLRGLTEREIAAFKIFDQYFGVGVNSVLFDELRTKKSLVYDVLTSVSNENYLKMYKIFFTTSKEKVDMAAEIIEKCVKRITCKKCSNITEEQLKNLVKQYKLRMFFREEKGIESAKLLSTVDTMDDDYNVYLNEFKIIETLTADEVMKAAEKVLKNYRLQIIE